MLEGLRGVYIAKLGFRDNNQEDIRTGWEMVERNVGRLSAMIMLYCSRERSPRRIPVSLLAVVQEVVNLFSNRAADLGIKLETEIAGNMGTMLAEPKDIHSLISNLLTNAIDACSSDPEEVKAHRIARVHKCSAQSVIEVVDEGCGIAESEAGAERRWLFP